jgi:hypothetical protein
MGFRSFKQRTPKPEIPNGPPRLRPIAHQRQWSLTEYVCTAGPHDRPFEERHDRVSVALVTAGTFRYRTTTGEGLLYPGAFLLGNAGACYECGHEHSHGDRCLALHIDRELFAEIASGSSGSNRCEFRAAMLPALSDLASISVSLQQASSPQSQLALEETVLSRRRDSSTRSGNEPHTATQTGTGGDATDGGRIGLYRCPFRERPEPCRVVRAGRHEQVPFSSNLQTCERHDAAPIYSGSPPARGCGGTAYHRKASCSRRARSGIW